MLKGMDLTDIGSGWNGEAVSKFPSANISTKGTVEHF
jgi:hypothetical protein